MNYFVANIKFIYIKHMKKIIRIFTSGASKLGGVMGRLRDKIFRRQAEATRREKIKQGLNFDIHAARD